MRELSGFWRYAVGVLVAVWSVFLLYTALTVALHPVLQGSISLSFGLAIVFLAYPLSPGRTKTARGAARLLLFGSENAPSLLDLLLLGLSVAPCLYIMFSWEEIVRNPGQYEMYQLYIGGVLILGLLEGTRRSLGAIIPLLVGGFLIYALYGENIPGRFGHGGFGMEEVLYQIYLMTEGVWGLLTDMTSRLIALFVIFGPVLFATGVGKTFMDLAKLGGGRIRGGPGHVAVIASSFFGMLSGSAVANVATTGAFTIPTMKRMGFPPPFAGAVEATASSGGQIMPPIMGAGAFIMAEFMNVPYLTVMVAAIIPAIIFYFGVGAGVYVEACRYGLGTMPPEMMPKLREVLHPRQLMVFVLPVGTLLFLLVLMMPPQMCAAWALVVTMGVFLLTGGAFTARAIWERITTIWEGYFRAILTALAWLMVMMSCVQVAVSLISLTGFGVKVSQLIIELAGTHISLALGAAMLTALILGMGMTTTAAYVIAAAVLIPAMAGLNLPLLASHLFVFYFAVFSGLTPPVCIAVYTGAAIAGSRWLPTAWISIRLAVSAFVLPFYFMFNTAYLMQGSALEIALLTLGGLAAMLFVQGGIMGYLGKHLTYVERALLIVGGMIMLAGGKWTLIGLAVGGAGYLLMRFDLQIPLIGVRSPGMEALRKD
jgi:TRAP transporter 4TM/12TM fusion protein